MTPTWRQRARVALLALAALGPAGAHAAPAPRFRHAQHEKDCTSCHRMSAANGWVSAAPVASGKEGHEPCSSCHDHERMFRPPFPPKAQRLAFCGTCHGSGGTDFKRAVYPPYRERGESEYVLATYDHGKHLADTRCESCHAPADPKGWRMGLPDHRACATAACHAGPAQPAMSACTACHQPKTGEVAPLASRARDPYRTGAVYGHLPHAAKAKRLDCAGCHVNVAVGAGAPVPLPPMISCEGCHDGTTAFYALGFGCKKCHALGEAEQAAARGPAPSAPIPQFSHARHAAKGVPLACESCHFSTPAGRLKFPVPDDHRPCANCHQHREAFRTAGAPLCQVCHQHSDPFRPNPLRAAFRRSTELVTTFGHQHHAEVDCATCHPESAGLARDPRAAVPGILAPSHEVCSSCHEKLQKPPMTQCGACHALPKGDALSSKEPWRVAAKFQHQTHLADVRTAPVVDAARVGWARVERSGARAVDCARCHAGVQQAPLGQVVPRPTMQSCADCHQGTWAFKTTGTACMSCHGPVERGSGSL